MLSKRSIQILGVITVSVILVCIIASFYINSTGYSKNQLQSIKPGFGEVDNSEFELTPQWYQKSVSNYESYFNFNGSAGKFTILMGVDQYPNKFEYTGSYVDTSQKTSEWRVVSAGNKTIEKVNVETIEIMRCADTETTMYYFFGKNGKYYSVFIDIGGTKALQYFNGNKDLVNRTVSTIVRTIH